MATLLGSHFARGVPAILGILSIIPRPQTTTHPAMNWRGLPLPAVIRHGSSITGRPKQIPPVCVCVCLVCVTDLSWAGGQPLHVTTVRAYGAINMHICSASDHQPRNGRNRLLLLIDEVLVFLIASCS
ncbi:unnamed protein product [Ectocarpus sp. 6 AP-2014]